jgi:hypothetical protein
MALSRKCEAHSRANECSLAEHEMAPLFAHCQPVFAVCECERASPLEGDRCRFWTLATGGRGQKHLRDRRSREPSVTLCQDWIEAPMSTKMGRRRWIDGGTEADDAPIDAPDSGANMAAIYEFRFTRRRVAESFGTVRSPADVASLLSEFVRPDTAESEQLVVALLDTKNAIIGVETVYVGNVAGSSVRVGEVFRSAVRLNASALVVAHNHPSGDPTPSAEDVAVTREMASAGRVLDIALLDHVVLGSGGRSVSLRALGYLEA